jgi:hypothetical protein
VKSARSKPVTALITCFGGYRRFPITTKWLAIGSGSIVRNTSFTSVLRKLKSCPAIRARRSIVLSDMNSLRRFLCCVSAI